MEMACDSGHNPRGKKHLLFSGVTLYVFQKGNAKDELKKDELS